jgi:hypothetical protein
LSERKRDGGAGDGRRWGGGSGRQRRGGLVARVPHGAGRAWGLAPTGGRRCVNRGAPSSDAWAMAGSGRERRGAAWGTWVSPGEKNRSGPSPEEQEGF